jgi:dipeptide transport system ATP-binding protein
MSDSSAVVLEAKDLAQHYKLHRGMFAPSLVLKAVDGVSISLSAGKTQAVVGESGSGK